MIRPPFMIVIGTLSIGLVLFVAGRTAELRSVFLEDLSSDELCIEMSAGYDRVLVFSGSVEASGPHLALGKHNFRSQSYAERIARELGNTLVAPIVPVAPTDEKLQRFAGTISIRRDVFADLNEDIVRSLVATGFKDIILLSDHGGAQEPLRAVARRMDTAFKSKGVRIFFSSDGYEKSTQEIVKYAQDHNLDAGGHGGLWDTSELWAVDPSAVRPDRLNLTDSLGAPSQGAGMVIGDPKLASPELGRIFGNIRVKNAVAEIRTVLSSAR